MDPAAYGTDDACGDDDDRPARQGAPPLGPAHRLDLRETRPQIAPSDRLFRRLAELLALLRLLRVVALRLRLFGGLLGRLGLRSRFDARGLSLRFRRVFLSLL